ncbi:MAG: hypothetical protein IT430_09615 [Phycisphaerales bacterium]|nr:hypothetical protein [Phycisphaerales bacterium]
MSLLSIDHSSRRKAFRRGWTCGLILTAGLATVACGQDHPAPPAATAAGDSAASSDVYFGPKFKKDRVVVYEFRAENMSVQTQNDLDMIDSNFVNSVMRFTVNDVNEDGSADLTMTYDRIFTSGEAYFGGSYVFDSTQEAQDPDTDAKIIDALRQLANSTVKFHADAHGNVDPASVTGTEDACAAMDEIVALKGRVGEFNSNGLAELFESTWRVGNETYSRNVTQPWQDVQKTPVEGLGTWTFTSDYQLLDQTPEEIVLGMKMVMDLEFQPPDVQIEGMLKVLETKFDMLRGDFRYRWDPVNNELVERSGELEFRWLIVQEGIFEGETVRTDQHQHVKSSMTRIEG